MSKAVYYRLPTGQWRVTDAHDDWHEDGVTYPESNLNDQYFETEDDARAAWQARRARQSADANAPHMEVEK